MSKKAKRATRRRSAPRRQAKKARRSAPSKASAIRAVRLGDARAIEYRHADGKLYRHTFKRGTFLAQSDCGRYLIVGPVQVKRFIA